MTFPVYFKLFGITLHPHFVLECIAYTVGFQLYLYLRRQRTSAFVPLENNLPILVGCVFGALFGAKILSWLENPLLYWEHQHRANWLVWAQGKTIVGGFIGGWIGVEWAKKLLGVRHSTGDLYVFPLIVGTSIGRVGCFLSGLEDDTYGLRTALPWGVDFGDGPRHPTQLYEIAFLLVLGAFLLRRTRTLSPNGYLFRLFMLWYFLFRFVAEFVKPRPFLYVGLSAIQLASLAASVYCWKQMRTGGGRFETRNGENHETQRPD